MPRVQTGNTIMIWDSENAVRAASENDYAMNTEIRQESQLQREQT